MALAMANLDIPPNWNVLGSHSGDGEICTVLSCRTGIPTQLCLSKTHKMQFLFHEKMYLKIKKLEILKMVHSVYPNKVVAWKMAC